MSKTTEEQQQQILYVALRSFGHASEKVKSKKEAFQS